MKLLLELNIPENLNCPSQIKIAIKFTYMITLPLKIFKQK